MHKFFKNDKGFTLVELMVVVLIIGILVAIAIPVFNLAIDTARTNACKGSMRTVESAVISYDAAHPDAQIDTSAETAPTTADSTGFTTAMGLLVGTNLKASPKCPGTGFYYFGTGGVVACTQHGAIQ